ncbi:uncharacterized protein itprid1 isoform X2 [Engraulis encrasicolus]|uniref:uncharacterized protein itprid1 isoform X2 n=1 Tax=Engraulis encrasicolus TaxID=184585 RepID=UPI002FD556A7
MSADTAVEKRATLLASRAKWGKLDRQADGPPNTEKTGDYKQDSIQQWLSSMNRVDEKTEPLRKCSEAPLRRNASAEDDLVLGVEASLYGNPGPKTVKEFLRSSLACSKLTRWSSLTSAFSAQSNTLSVMDVLNLWNDDPEEVLLDLGFGAEVPDITGRIPSRFINHQSKARGINLDVFLEAQKNRMDLENPDVRSRFRQLEVLQQVTTAFNSLVGGGGGGGGGVGGSVSGSHAAPANMSPEAREKRKRMGMLLRRASKKTLSQARTSQDVLSPPAAPAPAPQASPGGAQSATTANPEVPGSPVHMPVSVPVFSSDKRGGLKRSRSSLVENGCLTTLVEEQGSLGESSEVEVQAEEVEVQAEAVGVGVVSTPGPQESPVRLRGHRELRGLGAQPAVRKRSPGEPMESFELEEIQSFDEGSLAGSVSGAADGIGESEQGFLSQTGSYLARTNSCQSDSSGFLEEPFIPAYSQGPCPGPELMKALNALSDSTDSQGTVRGSEDRSPTSPTFPTSSTSTSIFTSPSPACDPEQGDPSTSDPPEPPPTTPPADGSPQLVSDPSTGPSLDAAAEAGEEDAGTMGASQCCESEGEGVPCADAQPGCCCSESGDGTGTDGDTVGSDNAAGQQSRDGTAGTEDVTACSDNPAGQAGGGGGGGGQALSNVGSGQEQHSMDSAINKQMLAEAADSRAIVSEQTAACEVRDSVFVCENAEGTISDEAVNAFMSVNVTCVETVEEVVVVSAISEERVRDSAVNGEVASEHVVTLTEHVQCEGVVSKETVGENAASERVADSLTDGASKQVVSECENVINQASSRDTRTHGFYEHSSEHIENTEHTVGVGDDTTNSSQLTIAVEKIVILHDHQQASAEKLFSSQPAYSELETQSHTNDTPNVGGAHSSTTETSPPLSDSGELHGDSLVAQSSPVVPVEPSRPAERPSPHLGRSVSVSVQMRSTLAPISRTSTWRGGPSTETATHPSDVTQRRASFSRRAWSEAEVIHHTPPHNKVSTPQTLAIEIPELAPSSPAYSWHSQESGHGGLERFRKRSVSLDTGLSWEDGDGRLDGVMMAGTRACLCSCQCCAQHGAHMRLAESPSTFPYSLDQLEDMMRGVKRFRGILTEIEESLDHEQALVYEDLTTSDREEVRDVLELRTAVKQEARELELQLADLVHHYDDSFKMINRLLDEQSHLCSQLKINPSDWLGSPPPPPPPASPSRSVGVQCSLMPSTDTATHTHLPHPAETSSNTKQGKLDFVGFIQNVRVCPQNKAEEFCSSDHH